MNIDIDNRYEIGEIGEAVAYIGDRSISFQLIEYDDGEYGDIDLEITGDNGASTVITDIYNRNSLPDVSDVDAEQYIDIMNKTRDAIRSRIDLEIEQLIEEL